MANKRPFDSLSSDLEKAATRQRAAYGEVNRSLDAVIAELEKSRADLQALETTQSSASKDVIKSLGEKVKALKCPEAIAKENREYHAVLSKLGKAVDKHFVSDMSPVLKGIPVAERPLLHRSVAMHFMHRGQFKALERFSEELSSGSWHAGSSDNASSDWVIDANVRSAFEELHSITGSLEAHDVNPALNWLGVLPEAEQKKHAELSFELKALRFTQLLSGEDGASPAAAAAAALHYGRAELSQYLCTARGRDVAKLIGAVAFAGGESKNSPYASLADGARWGEASRNVRRAYCEGAAASPSQRSPLPSPPPSPPPSPYGPQRAPGESTRSGTTGTVAQTQGTSPETEAVDRSQINASLFPVPRELPPFPLMWRYPLSSAFGPSQEQRAESGSGDSQAQAQRAGGSRVLSQQAASQLQQLESMNPWSSGAHPQNRPNRGPWLEPQATATVGGRVRGSAAPRATFSAPAPRGSGSSAGGGGVGTAGGAAGVGASASSAGGRSRHPREHRATEERIRAMLMAQLLRRQASGQPEAEAAASIGANVLGTGAQTQNPTQDPGNRETPESRYLFSSIEPLRIAQRLAGSQPAIVQPQRVSGSTPPLPPAEGDEGAESQESQEIAVQQAWLSVPAQTVSGGDAAEGEDTAMSPQEAEETPTSFAPPPRVPSSESPQRTSETEGNSPEAAAGEETQITAANGSPQETDAIQADGETPESLAVKARVALPQHSLLSVTLSAGLRALPRLIHFFQMLKTSAAQTGGAVGAGSTLLEQSHLPVEIDLGPGFHFHTTFTCAVSRSQTSRGNPAMLLACGHCISKQCLDRLARVARGRTVKCPICPQHQDPQAAKRLYF
eukprot:gnl/MRDRNA2_/MRDRNA2_65802_c0_seq1.p1 gnl/MRDRNA2_/MRDRNA2_65802_c0~~gnl/MRDRNA2_/MRDRNA2_65802_c0_seq1.p1  ORF type:complete len:880 (+),score=168.27 gnl/MRDRNA2_/MRDRNA2_65802_c0_seq1:100-2640(+)